MGVNVQSGATNATCSICCEDFDGSSNVKNNAKSRIGSFCRQLSRRINVIATLYPCNHQFHKKCIKKYLIKNLSCPNDRQLISGSDRYFSWYKYLSRQLISAVEKGQLEVVERIFELKAKKNITFTQSVLARALILAVKNGHQVVAEELIRHGASGRTAIYDLACDLFKKGSDIDTVCYVKAFMLFRMAAEEGDEKACNNLGYLYINGLGVGANPANAKQWFEKSARAGYSVAQYNLGLLIYNDGNCTDSELEIVLDWFRKAADKGHENAWKMIDDIKERSNLRPSNSVTPASRFEKLHL